MTTAEYKARGRENRVQKEFERWTHRQMTLLRTAPMINNDETPTYGATRQTYSTNPSNDKSTNRTQWSSLHTSDINKQYCEQYAIQVNTSDTNYVRAVSGPGLLTCLPQFTDS